MFERPSWRGRGSAARWIPAEDLPFANHHNTVAKRSGCFTKLQSGRARQRIHATYEALFIAALLFCCTGLGLKGGLAPGLVLFLYVLTTSARLACSIHATWGPPFSRALYIAIAIVASTGMRTSFLRFPQRFVTDKHLCDAATPTSQPIY